MSSNNQASSLERENQRIKGVHIYRDKIMGKILRKRVSSLQVIYQVSIANEFMEDDKTTVNQVHRIKAPREKHQTVAQNNTQL